MHEAKSWDQVNTKYDLLNELQAYKVRPAANELPYKFETGTQNHEGIAGVLGALEYFEWIGSQFGDGYADHWKEAGYSGRRLVYKQALSAIHRSTTMNSNCRAL